MNTYPVLNKPQIIDRATVRCVLDLGFGLSATIRFQLTGIDPSESDNDEIVDFIRSWFADRELIARTTKNNSTTVGETWLAEFIDAQSGEHLTAALIDAGYGS